LWLPCRAVANHTLPTASTSSYGQHHPKTDIVVPVVGVVPITVRAARVVGCVVPRTTAASSTLWQRLTSWANLHAAWQAAARGKRSQPEVATFELALEHNLFTLQSQLQSGSYHPAPYRSFHIHDPKHRLVSAAAFADRVVHHALVQIIEPLFEKQFSEGSYANRVGKGTHKALDRAQHFMRGHRYVLQCDIKQFFPSVDHAVLLQLLERSVRCKNTLALCRTILASGDGVLASEYTQVYFAGDDLLASQRPRGLPIGNLTSQFWANVYMNALNQHIQRTLRCKAYVRYVDDFALFSNDKAQLWAWKTAIRDKLNALRLTMHGASSTVYPVKNGMPFLGMQLFAEHRRLRLEPHTPLPLQHPSTLKGPHEHLHPRLHPRLCRRHGQQRRSHQPAVYQNLRPAALAGAHYAQVPAPTALCRRGSPARRLPNPAAAPARGTAL
jgi:RNA-directed DNA polymerase